MNIKRTARGFEMLMKDVGIRLAPELLGLANQGPGVRPVSFRNGGGHGVDHFARSPDPGGGVGGRAGRGRTSTRGPGRVDAIPAGRLADERMAVGGKLAATEVKNRLLDVERHPEKDPVAEDVIKLAEVVQFLDLLVTLTRW